MRGSVDSDVVSEVLLSAEQLQEKVRELGAQVSQDYEGKELWLVSVLKGGAFFLVDLARAISVPVAIDFFGISSYAQDRHGTGRNARPTGVVRITKDLDQSIEDREVLMVEDIVDTGLTLGYIRRVLEARRPASLRTCVLLDRPFRRIVELPIEYRGFQIPDVFVVGYGLDWQQKYRNLPYLGVLNPDLYDRAHTRMPWEA